MSDEIKKLSLSVLSKGARAQFAIGLALVSVIPLLTFWYLSLFVHADRPFYSYQSLALLVMVCAMGFSGYAILHKYPLKIGRLRDYLEHIIQGKLPEQVKLVTGEDDMRVVEKCLNLILVQLQERLEILQAEKAALQQKVFQLQKMECLSVMAAGTARAFDHLLADIGSQLTRTGPALAAGPGDIETLLRRGAALTNQMLVYAGQGRFVMERVDLVPLVRDTVRMLNASGDGLRVEFASECPTLTVTADPAQLRQALINLATFARDSAKPRQALIRISTAPLKTNPDVFKDCVIQGVRPRDTAACIEVRDNGPGIAPEVLPRIFEPFAGSKSDDRGLDLAVIPSILKAHKGAVAADSEAGKGARFRLLLPIH